MVGVYRTSYRQPEAQGQPNERQLRALVRSLLADRFKLEVQRGTKDLPVYALSVGTGGAKLSRNDTNPNGLPSLFFKGLGTLPALNTSMADFAGVMQAAVLDRPVVDKTGLSGRFDFTLRWTPDDSQFRGMGVRVPAPVDDPNARRACSRRSRSNSDQVESTNAPGEVLVSYTRGATLRKLEIRIANGSRGSASRVEDRRAASRRAQ